MAKPQPKPPVTPDLLSTENQQPPAEQQEPGPPYIIDSAAINGPVEAPDMLTGLSENRIMKITKQPDGRFCIREQNGEFFDVIVTAHQLRSLGQELIVLSESHE